MDSTSKTLMVRNLRIQPRVNSINNSLDISRPCLATENHKRQRKLGRPLIHPNPNNARILDVRVIDQLAFELARNNLQSLVFDHLLDAVLDSDISLSIDRGDVA